MIKGLGMTGIAETMDCDRVLNQEPALQEILNWGKKEKLMIDGHAPGLKGKAL